MEKMINKMIRMNEIRKEIAWISSEYTRMFPTDPKDLTMVADNDRLHSSFLLNLLNGLKKEIKDNNYGILPDDMLLIVKLETKLLKTKVESLDISNKMEDKCWEKSFGLKVD